jgi:nicotinic acid mononucleotide adenylyltransferase
VELFELAPAEVTSTGVRARIARGEPVSGLVPPAVAERIAALGLYRRG